MAELGGITASTLRAYISRGNSKVPQPQATVGGRGQWARAVTDDWVEARRRSYEGVRATMTAGDRDNLSPGAAEVRGHFADDFRSLLGDRPDVRKRWVLRSRNEDSVREVANALAWDVAVSLDRICPPSSWERPLHAGSGLCGPEAEKTRRTAVPVPLQVRGR
ncbi:hypothetical protein [Streptomyces lancefieldiae]|uniref:Uncharacterized protein n=1 Tax=Streptomyces lancefieldiae TaxID=3075520 RepID=A0ABU3B0Y7_9ACTN|nr:hypothetical protein [Streptomyces sp. DSM 40712]MDT0616117.1 hypothetical protein [Streptomyces sp. DSM 40712]